MTNLIFGVNIEEKVAEELADCVAIVTDSNVNALYPKLTENAIVIPAGENSKTAETLLSVIDGFAARAVARNDVIAAVGGGVVGDIAGLAAALYMRGIDWINVPTTLLAMADAGIGGKTAIDRFGVKNSIGAFHFPRRTVISFAFTDTLDEREWLSGCGEIIKTCLLTENSFKLLRDNIDGLIVRDRAASYALAQACIEIKDAIVTADPFERGLRKTLNVGHTVGHALESADGFKSSHGEYVVKGMMTECAMCADLMDGDYYSELISLFKRFTAPPRTTANAVYEFAVKDKKSVDGTVNIMLPSSCGKITDVRLERGDFIERYTAALKELKRI